jgi:hypothetical protein
MIKRHLLAEWHGWWGNEGDSQPTITQYIQRRHVVPTVCMHPSSHRPHLRQTPMCSTLHACSTPPSPSPSAHCTHHPRYLPDTPLRTALCSSSSLHKPPTIPAHPPFTILPCPVRSAPCSSTLALSPPPITPAVLISPDERSPVIASTWCGCRGGPAAQMQTLTQCICSTREAGLGEIVTEASCADEEAGGQCRKCEV